MMDNDEIQQIMEDNTVISGSNMWILIMAIFIASIGLNVNSTAVIIGAMLISPLTVATSEMIARTSPTLWNVLIALFGGIAGGRYVKNITEK